MIQAMGLMGAYSMVSTADVCPAPQQLSELACRSADLGVVEQAVSRLHNTIRAFLWLIRTKSCLVCLTVYLLFKCCPDYVQGLIPTICVYQVAETAL